MEAWQMTREEYLNKEHYPELPIRAKLLMGSGLADFDEVVGSWHKRFVLEAIERGNHVPENVKDEYIKEIQNDTKS